MVFRRIYPFSFAYVRSTYAIIVKFIVYCRKLQRTVQRVNIFLIGQKLWPRTGLLAPRAPITSLHIYVFTGGGPIYSLVKSHHLLVVSWHGSQYLTIWYWYRHRYPRVQPLRVCWPPRMTVTLSPQCRCTTITY